MIHIEKVRAIFKGYRQQAVELRQQIAELEENVDSESYFQEAAASRANQRADACRRECEEARRQEESDRYYREDQVRAATRELERAREWHDEWGEDRAIAKLKRL